MSRGLRWLVVTALAALAFAPLGTGLAIAALGTGPAFAGVAAPPVPDAGLLQRLAAIRAGIDEVERSLDAGNAGAAGDLVLRLYLDEFEPIEGWWGAGGRYATPELASAVARGEVAFHAVLAAEPESMLAATATLREALEPIQRAARAPGVVLVPIDGESDQPAGPVVPPRARTPEIRPIVSELESARLAYREGRADTALAAVEHAYLEGFEPLESRLPSDLVGRIERAIHLGLRPSIRSRAPVERVDAAFAALYADLAIADRRLSGGASFWFGAVNSFAIVFREGLEAVLLVGAMLAYLGRLGTGRRPVRQVYAGVVAGLLASLATWAVAVTLVPVSGASRELVEGVTALIAVAVLLYVSHWLFQKTYIHGWKAYLEEHLGRAVTRGSALAMAGLAFAAVYREGFETVLFYQALMFDAGAGAVLAGFVPGILVIAGIGYGIVKLGLRLPLRRVFAVTGAVLLYLAFVFIGKGLYNLQEAGLFAPHPLSRFPDHEALRQLFGLYPLVETILAQAAFLLFLVAGTVWLRARARSAAPKERADDSRVRHAPAGHAPADSRASVAETVEIR